MRHKLLFTIFSLPTVVVDQVIIPVFARAAGCLMVLGHGSHWSDVQRVEETMLFWDKKDAGRGMAVQTTPWWVAGRAAAQRSANGVGPKGGNSPRGCLCELWMITRLRSCPKPRAFRNRSCKRIKKEPQITPQKTRQQVWESYANDSSVPSGRFLSCPSFEAVILQKPWRLLLRLLARLDLL